ncbi:MAG: hypothetical protein H6Q65_1803 [Firmicutes bacterium]|nr:hypothetical protein [Bacillota bacterium]
MLGTKRLATRRVLKRTLVRKPDFCRALITTAKVVGCTYVHQIKLIPSDGPNKRSRDCATLGALAP